MQRQRLSLLLVLLLMLAAPGPVGAQPPAERVAHLRHGIAITNWFRYPPNAAPAALRRYLSDAALAQLRAAGFTAIRLPVQPDLLQADATRMAVLVGQIRRLQHHGFAVLVAVAPVGWRLEHSDADRAALFAFWDRLGPALASLDPDLTIPELLNEPVFPGSPDAWRDLQHRLLVHVRAMLPRQTIVLSGNDWGSLGGLLALRPDPDPNVVYSFHFYEPPELTSLAAYRPGLDRSTLRRLPFPADDRTACFQIAESGIDPGTAALIRFYCGLRWNVARLDQRIDAAAAWARRFHATVLLGEFGATAALAPAARLAWLRSVRQRAEQDGIGWSLWGYDDVMGLNLPRPPPGQPRLDPAVLRVLGLGAPS